MKYKVIRIFEIEAISPLDAMSRADEHDLVYQKAVPIEEQKWTTTATSQLLGNGKRGK